MTRYTCLFCGTDRLDLTDMIPTPPPRVPQCGFLYLPPYRVQGISIAGEESAVQVPELNVCFDIGRSPRLALASSYIALSHGHMDHSGGLPYYFSQRYFQGMDVGSVVCHRDLETPIHNIMRAWVQLEAQRTPYKVIALMPDEQIEIKNNIFLRAFETVHTVPSLGFVVLERRSKLRPELAGLPQEKLLELKSKDEPITHTIEIPLVCYSGDTAMGPHFDRDDVLDAAILICECTFLEPGHRGRASVGRHLHLDDVLELLDRTRAKAVVLTHISRRTHIASARDQLRKSLPARHRDRVFLLMDGRENRARYENQQCEATASESG